MNLSEMFSKKVAGVPVIYIAALFVAILGVVAWRMKATEPPTEATGDESTTPENVPDDKPDYSGFGGTSIPVAPSMPSDAAGTVTPESDTNEKWLNRAAMYLYKSGKTDPASAQLALTKYLNGESMSYEQGQLRNAAIAEHGYPPDGLTQIGTSAAKPAQKQFTNFPGKHVIKGSNDNTLSLLASLYYGRNDATTVNLLRASNNWGTNGGPFPVGTSITIPAYKNPVYYTVTKTTTWSSQIAKKNRISTTRLQQLNPTLKYPQKVGAKVRVA